MSTNYTITFNRSISIMKEEGNKLSFIKKKYKEFSDFAKGVESFEGTLYCGMLKKHLKMIEAEGFIITKTIFQHLDADHDLCKYVFTKVA